MQEVIAGLERLLLAFEKDVETQKGTVLPFQGMDRKLCPFQHDPGGEDGGVQKGDQCKFLHYQRWQFVRAARVWPLHQPLGPADGRAGCGRHLLADRGTDSRTREAQNRPLLGRGLAARPSAPARQSRGSPPFFRRMEPRGSALLRAHADNCMHTFQWDCNKECPFLHVKPAFKTQDCPWYDGFCKHSPLSKYQHVCRTMCTNYVASFCPEGPRCQFAQ
ncbi:LOW QUALITY PROTEIN: putative cleavage and polyadenylation specificity factor subunit 4-like protein [Dama dama]